MKLTRYIGRISVGKMNKRIIMFLILGMFMVGFISAWSTDTFNNSLTEENII